MFIGWNRSCHCLCKYSRFPSLLSRPACRTRWKAAVFAGSFSLCKVSGVANYIAVLMLTPDDSLRNEDSQKSQDILLSAIPLVSWGQTCGFPGPTHYQSFSWVLLIFLPLPWSVSKKKEKTIWNIRLKVSNKRQVFFTVIVTKAILLGFLHRITEWSK